MEQQHSSHPGVDDDTTPNTDERSPPSSPSPVNAESNGSIHHEQQQARQQKKVRKKRKGQSEEEKSIKKKRKGKLKDGSSNNNVTDGGETRNNKKPRKPHQRKNQNESLSAAQLAVNEQMRRALEDDAYSALGSIVDTDTDDDDHDFRTARGGTVRLDRNTILTAMRKRLWIERLSGSNTAIVTPNSTSTTTKASGIAVDDDGLPRKKKRKTHPLPSSRRNKSQPEETTNARPEASADAELLTDDTMDRDEGSIFGQTIASNSTWVECDKCKKWRRLRGVVDEKKLPSKWYCSMNKNDPERARCSAPEEEYETPNTPESAADARTRKHLRVWVRRLESNENYEARQHPTMTRGKKRSAAASAKEPYEWIRCCNPSCGKWRALLRCMDSKQHVIDQTIRGEWYCVMNTWDEKMASCAAPQENLPVIGCPPWVMKDTTNTGESGSNSSSSRD